MDKEVKRLTLEEAARAAVEGPTKKHQGRSVALVFLH